MKRILIAVAITSLTTTIALNATADSPNATRERAISELMRYRPHERKIHTIEASRSKDGKTVQFTLFRAPLATENPNYAEVGLRYSFEGSRLKHVKLSRVRGEYDPMFRTLQEIDIIPAYSKKNGTVTSILVKRGTESKRFSARGQILSILANLAPKMHVEPLAKLGETLLPQPNETLAMKLNEGGAEVTVGSGGFSVERYTLDTNGAILDRVDFDQPAPNGSDRSQKTKQLAHKNPR